MFNIKDIKTKLIPILEANGVKRSSLFGSVARGDARDDSDIDILVEFKSQKSLFDLVGLQHEIEDKLGRKADVITYNSIHPLLKDYIYNDEIKIYG